MLEGARRILKTTMFVTLASSQPCMGWCLLQMKLPRRGGSSALNYYCSALTIRSIGGKAGTEERVYKKNPQYRLNTTGGLRNLPIIQPADELLAGAVKRSMRITQDVEIKNSRNRSRKWTAQRMDSLSKEVSKPLRHVLDQYKRQIPILHPFEATVADLTVRAIEKRGNRTLKLVLQDVNDLRKNALVIGKTAASKAKTLEKRQDIIELMDDGYVEMESLFNEKGHCVTELKEIQSQLRRIPVVKLHLPTVVLVGAPNVGKSSIVRALSTGTPEVNNYPFTTRGMTMGHVLQRETGCCYQMMDTPGLLSRPDEKRNEMECLTLASMQHLPTAVVFVLDLSGYSGDQSSIERQIKVRNEIRKRFPKRPWVDVISKSDMPRCSSVDLCLPESHIDVSVMTGDGLEELGNQVSSMLEGIAELLENEEPTEGRGAE
eukprot:462063_1